MAERRLSATHVRLLRLFNKDQLEAIGRRLNRRSPWQTDTIKSAIQLRFTCGATGYAMLLSKGYPLPSMRTPREKLQVIPFKPGLY